MTSQQIDKDQLIKYLTDCMGAQDPTCYTPDYYDGFWDAIKFLKNYE